ncbi:MAG: asparagine synthase (glutamine-hydrolyzing) [Nitrospira sp.]|nr:asparagine synthase (glutamine-hydrolyzing) [Nitrospira sp.]MBL8052961.1 asparagine synthase (glutamine-hydrolyzing) [Nitrospira sp.]
MCGITGWVSHHVPPQRDVLDRMCDAQVHRGPDDRGVYIDGPAGIAMRRLSILDVASGHQPIHNEDRSLWIVFNGEIYNYQELRSELEAKGHRFYTNTDTEAILHLYEDYGDKTPERLRGMFAFAIWDRERQMLYVARDRFGIKPFYYFWDDHTFLFASEIKSLLLHECVQRTLDLQGLNSFFTFGYFPFTQTPFQSIRKLLPGHAGVVTREGFLTFPYWELRESVQVYRDEREYLDVFVDIFTDAVKQHMLSEVPLGAFLSGGVDSSLVVATMRKLSSRPIETFAIGYEGDGTEFDERVHARVVAQHCETNHHEFVVKPNMMECLPNIIRQYDEPVGDSSAIPNYYLSQFVRRHVTVALSGLGGDEICAGYERYLGCRVADVYRQVPSAIRDGILRPLVECLPDSTTGHPLPQRAKRFVRSAALPLADRYLDLIAKFSRSERRQLFSADVLDEARLDQSSDMFADHWSHLRSVNPLNKLLEFDVSTYLVDDLLTLADRMSMAHSLEARVPFLDHMVVQYLWSVPPRLKLNGLTKKYLLKKAAERVLPKSIVYRRKQGFSTPLTVWFRGSLKDTLLDLLSSTNLDRLGIFNRMYVDAILAEHLQGRANHDEKLFALVSTVMWFEEYRPS